MSPGSPGSPAGWTVSHLPLSFLFLSFYSDFFLFLYLLWLSFPPEGTGSSTLIDPPAEIFFSATDDSQFQADARGITDPVMKKPKASCRKCGTSLRGSTSRCRTLQYPPWVPFSITFIIFLSFPIVYSYLGGSPSWSRLFRDWLPPLLLKQRL